MPQNTPILSILIPTYNRAELLDECLKNLADLAFTHREKIEILVSDNASTDATSDVAKRHGKKISGFSYFSYSKNLENIGVSKNIISLFKKARGHYLVFIGDDDYLNNDSLVYVLEILSGSSPPSAIIQACWQGSIRTRRSGFSDYRLAPKLFYEYGNAFAGIINRDAALRVLDSRKIALEIEKIVWPQTVIGYLAIFMLKQRPIYIADFEIGGSIRGSQNLTNKSYWLTSLYGLLRASVMIDEHIGLNWTKRQFVSLSSKGFLGHIKAVIYYGLISESSDSSFVAKELQAHFGLLGQFWSLVLTSYDRFPRLFTWVSVVGYSFAKRKTLKSAFRKLSDAKDKYAEGVLLSKEKKIRHGDWF